VSASRYGLAQRQGGVAVETQALGDHGGPQRQHGRAVDADLAVVSHQRSLQWLTDSLAALDTDLKDQAPVMLQSRPYR
jgi:hypothetical protein